MHFAGSNAYERNYIVGALLLLLTFAWPLGATAWRAIAESSKGPRDPERLGRGAVRSNESERGPRPTEHRPKAGRTAVYED